MRGQLRFTHSGWVPASCWCPRALALSPTQLTTWSTSWPAQTSVTGTPGAGSSVPLAASATGHPRPWMAASSCAVAGASTPRRPRWWSAAAASFAGAAPSSASSAGTGWRCTAAAEGGQRWPGTEQKTAQGEGHRVGGGRVGVGETCLGLSLQSHQFCSLNFFSRRRVGGHRPQKPLNIRNKAASIESRVSTLNPSSCAVFRPGGNLVLRALSQGPCGQW